MTPGAWMDGLLGCLRTAGSSVEPAHHGDHAADLLDQTPTEDPHLVEHVRYHLDEDTMADDDSDLLLDLIPDGLERRAGVAS